VEPLCKTGAQRLGDLKARDLLALGVLLLIVCSFACGRHKAQVKAPPPSLTSKEAKKQTPTVPSAPPPQEKPAQAPEAQPPAAAEATAGPTIRIGLVTAAKEIRISSPGDYYVTQKIPDPAPQLLQGETEVRAEQEVEETTSVYRVQVASFTQQDNAEDLKKKLAEIVDVPVIIRRNAAAGTTQVRVGEFPAKEEAQAFLATLVHSGYRDAFVVRETVSAGGGKTVLALHGPNNLFRLSPEGFLFTPSSGSSVLRVEGKPYRGLIEITLNKSSRITVVNQLGMEEYLLGVVPAEINPTAYPEFAALAAQSIAARTYALKNMGKFRSEGFDLSDDTRTQVYNGVSGERSATNEAVRQTYGLAIYYEGKLIDAMYMSTCGGRTEDFSNVFDAAPVPYLKSVFCAIESGPEKGEIIIEGKAELEPMVPDDDGGTVNRNLEFARILGLTGSGSKATSPGFLAGQTDRDEAVGWVEDAKRIAQRTSAGNPPAVADLSTRAGFLRYAAESFFGADEIRRRISARDVAYYMSNLKDGNSVPEPDRPALTYLMQNGLWRPYSDNTVRPEDSMRRSDALSLLLRWIESARPEILRKGTFVGAGSPSEDSAGGFALNVKWGNRTQEIPLSPKPSLFRLDSGRITAVSSLRLIGNEKMTFHVSSSGTIDFLQIELNPTGASSDRYSPAATWDTTLTRSAVAEKLRGLAGPAGELRDLKPYRLGNSGRVVQIQVVGSRGSVVLNGYKVRNALGLRDTLFTLKREYDPDGTIASFTFHGRGWGHGVGLCQVGAFGMARAGRSYEEILKTYYQGVQIQKAY